MKGTWGEGDLTEIWQGWAEELRNFGEHPGAIKYALEHLPSDYPPNLLQFKEMCREGLKFEPKPLAIERKLTHEEMEFNRLKIEQVAKSMKPVNNHRKWIYRLQERIDAGERFPSCVERIFNEARIIERLKNSA
jgi:hypothetical protein